MKFQKQIFGFMDMLRFKELVPNRRKALASGADTPLPKRYRVNELAKALHPGRMQVEVTALRPLTDGMTEPMPTLSPSSGPDSMYRCRAPWRTAWSAAPTPSPPAPGKHWKTS